MTNVKALKAVHASLRIGTAEDKVAHNRHSPVTVLYESGDCRISNGEGNESADGPVTLHCRNKAIIINIGNED